MKSSKSVAIGLLASLTVCMMNACRINEDLSVCANKFSITYVVKLVTNMTTELRNVLNQEADEPVARALYDHLKDKVTFFFDTPVEAVRALEQGYEVVCKAGTYTCADCIISVGRIGSKWMEQVCRDLKIPTKSNRVDIGVRVELPAEIFSHLTDELYESKIVYRTKQYGDKVRTFCMNPKGSVVNENTNGIITVNGHSYEDQDKKTDNTNFALLVAKHRLCPKTVVGNVEKILDIEHTFNVILRFLIDWNSTIIVLYNTFDYFRKWRLYLDINNIHSTSHYLTSCFTSKTYNTLQHATLLCYCFLIGKFHGFF